jgi:hypothetical protein
MMIMELFSMFLFPADSCKGEKRALPIRKFGKNPLLNLLCYAARSDRRLTKETRS